jgi:hypothetical protein
MRHNAKNLSFRTFYVPTPFIDERIAIMDGNRDVVASCWDKNKMYSQVQTAAVRDFCVIK